MKPLDNAENDAKCSCPQCPLFTDCNEKLKEALFCARGKSGCSMDADKRCICGSCPVHQENKLNDYKYCIHGASE
ncbi:MAG: DUF2769 domain-containing protein [Candidatus Pacebacteria bacterium]|nr:DUF2769 domain-containing protein [Candidatus Paceibacterota bacterium]